MASRFHTTAHRDSARSSLFSGYDQAATTTTNTGPRSTSSRPSSVSPAPGSSAASVRPGSSLYYNGGFSHSSASLGASGGGPGPGFSAYPGGGGANVAGLYGAQEGGGDGGFRSATPSRRGVYSDAVLSGLESQNEEQVSEMGRKVAMLKDITLRIGDEIRDSTALAEKMNDSFGNTSVRLKGTMNRMLRMAEKTGVGWKVWLAFFAFVILLFWYVWLF